MIYLRGYQRQLCMSALKWRGVWPPTLKAVDANLVLDDVYNRRNRLAPVLRLTGPLRAVSTWRKQQRRSPALVLEGPYGDGKTIALAWVVAAWGEDVTAGALPKLITEARLVCALHGDRRTAQGPDRETVRACTIAPLLALDEVGVSDAAPWQLASLRALLLERWASGRYTVLAANPTATLKEPVKARVGGRLWDRWTEGGVSPVHRTPPAAHGLRQDTELHAFLTRYHEALDTAYDEAESKPVTAEQRAEIDATLARLKARGEQARREREAS